MERGVSSFGTAKSGKTHYKHLLTAHDEELNFINEDIYNAVIERFSNHKAGDIDRVKYNSVASQAYCFNLFVPLQQNFALASQLFTSLLSKEVEVKHIEIEFTPNKLDTLEGFETNGQDESIGDQSAYAGTDADIAVFYKDSGQKKGVILIEFKFIESEFSKCSSYKKKEAEPLCNSSEYWDAMVEQKKTNSNNRFLCGYNKYDNWELTLHSDYFDMQKIKESDACPFRFSLNQLWRNMLLAEKVKEVRQLDESHFWVFSPSKNDSFLWTNHGQDVENQLSDILSEKGNKQFSRFSLENVISLLDSFELSQSDVLWLDALKDRYLI